MQKTDLEIASEMFKHEHTRWIQNSLLFLAILGAILISLQHLKEIISLWLIFLIAALTSFLWLCAIIANRRTTHAWLRTIKELETKSTEVNVFSKFDAYARGFNHWKDIFSNFGIVKENDSGRRGFLLLSSVTRAYFGLALIMTIAFSYFSCSAFLKRADGSSDEALNMLGRDLIKTEISKLFLDGRIVEASGPLHSGAEHIFQVRVVRGTGEQALISWSVDSLGRVTRK